MDTNTARAEDMLAEIARLQEESEQARAAARRSQQEAEAAAERIRVRLNSIDDERRVLLQEAREAAAREVEGLRAEVRKLRGRVVAAGGSLEEVKAIESAAEVVREMQEAVVAPPPPKPVEPQRKRPIQVGDAVRVRSLNSDAVVSAVMGGEADVQIGRMRMRVRLIDLERVRSKKREEEVEVNDKPVMPERGPSPGMELDIRGRLVEEGVAELEDYLDRAQRAGLPFVRIIHGKGTGALRKAVRDAVKRNAVTASFETGREGEGGDGVTVVKLHGIG